MGYLMISNGQKLIFVEIDMRNFGKGIWECEKNGKKELQTDKKEFGARSPNEDQSGDFKFKSREKLITVKEKEYSVISLRTGKLKGLIDLGKDKHVAFVIED
jgi:hypothetical protein